MDDSEKTLDVAEPVEEVAKETTEVVETPQNEVELVDGSPETKESVEESKNEEETTEEKKTEEPKEEPKEETKKDQTAKENANYAQIRRKAEEDANKKLESERQKAFNEGKLEAYKGKINPYTEKPITDLTDVEMYEEMYRLEQEGKDPIKDLPEALATKEREQAKAIQERKEMEAKTKEEIDEFQKKYPDVNLGELLQDSFFNDYIQGKNKSITELYEGFNNFKNAFRNSAVEVAKQTIANAQASPGALSSEADVTVDYNTMSSEEFARQVQMVKDGELK